MINILAIESSCDETAAALISDGKIRSNIVATQEIHAKYGGVVPELASRAHLQNIVPVVEEALTVSNIDKSALTAIAFTQGPGLLGALMVGTQYAKAMAWSLDLPLIGVHHMHAHIMAHFIDEPKPKFPFLCLTVSGGHTQLVIVRDYLVLEVIGETRDDAVGEAFDKCAKLLGLSYPGGPLIDKYAARGSDQAFVFPISKMEGYDFSFSGIKTAVMNFVNQQKQKQEGFIEEHLDDICASVQYTLLEMLELKVKQAMKDHQLTQLAIAGGVAANSGLRARLDRWGKEEGWETYLPDFQYCTDNAAMIAMAAHQLHMEGRFVEMTASPMPRMPLPS